MSLTIDGSANTGPVITIHGYELSPSSPMFTLHQQFPPQVIYSIDCSGKITWPNGIDITAAVQAFKESLSLSVEAMAGVDKGIKDRFRDNIFEDLIEHAAEKGPLTIENLQLIQETYKIVDILKGY